MFTDKDYYEYTGKREICNMCSKAETSNILGTCYSCRTKKDKDND